MSPIANMLAQIKNAQAAGHETVTFPYSSMKMAIADILRKKGFIETIEKKTKKAKKTELPYLTLTLKYINGTGVINDIKLVSKPSRRMYARKTDIKPIKSGYGLAVVSTSKGLMSGDEAKKLGVGGEVLFEIW